MAQPNFKLTVGAIDELLDQLAALAIEPKVETPAFLSRAVQVAESLLGLRWAAVLGLVATVDASRHDALFLAGSDVASREFSGLGTTYPRLIGESDRQADWLDRVQQSTSHDAVEIVCAGRTWGWLVAAKEPNQPFKSFETEVLEGVAEAVVEHLLATMARQNSELVGQRNRLDSFKLNTHRSLELKQAAKLIVNDARWLCLCERVTLLAASRTGKLKLTAVSSVATLDRKSDFKSKLERLANLAIDADVPLASDPIAGTSQSENRKLRTLRHSVEEWQQGHGFEFLFGLPVVDRVSKTMMGFLVFEANGSIDRPKFVEALRQVEPHVSVAMSNSRQFDSIPFRKTLQWVGFRFRLPNLLKVMFAVVAVVVFFAALALVESPFSVRTHGELLPRTDWQVCAGIEGDLASVLVRHGQAVQEGQLLATIQNAELKAELDSVEGEAAKVKQLIESKKILLGQYGHSGDQALMGRLAAEISDLNFQLELLANRNKFLLKKQDKLNVLAPQSGQVITWEPRAKLLGKPVRWGDGLFNVADLNGPWDIVLRVPESRIGYILDAGSDKSSQESLADDIDRNDVSVARSVTFFLKSDPGNRYTSEIVEVCNAVEVDPDKGKVTTIRCKVPADLVNRRHGATIVADIHCGDRPMWFVYFGEFYDQLRRRWVW